MYTTRATRKNEMNKRIKKKKLKQWIEDNVKVAYSVERLDNGHCKLYVIIKEEEYERKGDERN